jgi:hypothetical protein
MGRTRKHINEIQQRLNDIETAALQLMIFATDTPDAVLGARLKKIAKVIFKNAQAIEGHLKKPRKL